MVRKRVALAGGTYNGRKGNDVAQRNRLTNNSDETDIGALISGDTIFAIPYFQRPYKWKLERLKQLNVDLLALVDETNDFHFLGAVIVHGRRTNPSDPDVFDVIDGQQRITTLFLYLCAVVKLLANSGQYQEAAALFFKYLVINRDTGSLSNFKIQSCKEDRSQLNFVYHELIADEKFRAALGGFVLRPMAASGSDRGTLLNNYRAALRFLNDENEQGGLDRVRAIYASLLNRVSVVQIDVWDPTNGPKIFDSLNSRQEPMTVGDLIRNEVFSRVANEHPAIIERIDAEAWQPFYKKFDQGDRNLFDGYFFPYGLVKSPNLKKSEAYSFIRKGWEAKLDPKEIIQELAEYQDAYIDFMMGSNLSGHPKDVARAFRRLWEIKSPGSVLPFAMQLSRAISTSEVSSATAIEICQTIESFLVRRSVCGYEPTGLHAVFKRLWKDCDGEYSSARLSHEIAKHRTVPWPDNLEFANAIRERGLYGVSVTHYVVLEFDRSLGGDCPANVPWLEHVLPVNPDAKWFEIFTVEQHEKMKHRLANLLPLSSEMNRSLSNKPYLDKRSRFKEDSMFKSTRQFADGVPEWTPQELVARSDSLANWALSRWPHERPGSRVRETL